MPKRISVAIASLALLATLVPASLATAQPAEAPAQMQALAWLVGEWHGTGWTITPAGREEFEQHESIAYALDGSILTIYGTGHDTNGGAVVHEALGIVSYSEHQGGFSMRNYRLGGQHIDPVVTVGENELTWSFEIPYGAFRFVIRLDEGGRWVETGERSTDQGETWTEFFGMTLTRQASPEAPAE